MLGTLRSICITFLLFNFCSSHPGIVIGNSMGQDKHVTNTCAEAWITFTLSPYQNHPTGLNKMGTKKSAKAAFSWASVTHTALRSWIRPRHINYSCRSLR
ncbi:hypothetical protein BGX38DRAFT_320365 [Terfezia claveryi]|nr:hypothetical protein BGX38DRAFT_320365 [Terfezia claveryi]